MLKIRKEIIMEKFTNKELEIISNGLLSLIGNAVKAKGLVFDTASQNSIDDYMKTLQALNSKVCKMDEMIMNENVWIYEACLGKNGTSKGVVIADIWEDAQKKVYEYYDDFDGENEPEIVVRRAIDNDYYDKEYPDVIEVE